MSESELLKKNSLCRFLIPSLKPAQVLYPFFFEKLVFFLSNCGISLFGKGRSHLASLLQLFSQLLTSPLFYL